VYHWVVCSGMTDWRPWQKGLHEIGDRPFLFSGGMFSVFFEDHLDIPYNLAVRSVHRRLFHLLQQYKTVDQHNSSIFTNFVTIRYICTYIWMDFPMTKKRGNTPRQESENGYSKSPVTWVNVSLNDDVGLVIQEHYADDYETAGYLLALCSFATNVFVKYDEKTDSFCAGMIAPDVDNGGVQKGLSGWSNNPLDAVRALLCKWYLILEETWPEQDETPKSRFR